MMSSMIDYMTMILNIRMNLKKVMVKRKMIRRLKIQILKIAKMIIQLRNRKLIRKSYIHMMEKLIK